MLNKILTSAKTIRVLIYCLLPLLVSLGLLNSSQPRLNMIVSDLLYLVSLYKDLFVDRYSVLGWNLTPAPYFFPDMVMFFPLLWIMPDIGYAFVLYSVLFLLLFLAIITKIASYLNSNIFNCFLCIFSAGLIFVVLLENSNYVSLGLIFLFPSAHGGAIIIGFMLIAISLNALQKGYSSVSSAMFFTLSCLTIISDILIIPQFLIPLVIANFILYRLRFIPLRNFLIPVGLIVVAQLVASIILKVIKILGIFKTTTQKAINYFPNL